MSFSYTIRQPMYRVFILSLIFCLITLVAIPGLTTSAIADEAAEDTTPPAAVQDLQATVDKYAIHVTWTEPADADFSHVELSLKHPPFPSYDPAVEQLKGDASHTFTAHGSGFHQLRAIAYDTAGNASEVEYITVLVKRDGPPPVRSLRAQTEKTISTGKLSWFEPFDDEYDHFRISFKRQGGEYDPDKYTIVSKSAMESYDFGLPSGVFVAKVVTVDPNGAESEPVETVIDMTGAQYKLLIKPDQKEIDRNTNAFTISGHATHHHFTHIVFEMREPGGGIVDRQYITEWGEDGRFSKRFILEEGDETDYHIIITYYDPELGRYSYGWVSVVNVYFKPELPTLPEQLTTTAEGSDILVDWDLPEAPNYTYLELKLMSDGAEVDTVQVGSVYNHHRFGGLPTGAYTVQVTAVNDEGRSPEPYMSEVLTIHGARPLPVPVLIGPSTIYTDSGILIVDGRAESCVSCDVYVSIYDEGGQLLEEIKAMNWSLDDHTFSVRSEVDRPDGTYRVKANVRTTEAFGAYSNEITYVVLKPIPPEPEPQPEPNPTPEPEPQPEPAPSPASPPASPSEDPVIAPEPDVNERRLYLSLDAVTHSVFEDHIRLGIGASDTEPGTSLVVWRHLLASLKMPARYTAVSDGYTISGSKRAPYPMQLTLRYPEETQHGVDPAKLGIYRRTDMNDQAWVYMGGVVDSANHTITTSIHQPGTYAVLQHDLTFLDLAGHWSRPEIDLLASRHLVHGTGGQYFEPERQISRAEVVKLLVEAIASASNSSGLSYLDEAVFSDVPPNTWYYEYVNQAVSMGMILRDGTAFGPHEPITREELALMIYRTAATLDPSIDHSGTHGKLSQMEDAADISDWAREAFEYAWHSGIMQGTTQGKLLPQATTTRAQAAAIVLRAMKRWGLIERSQAAEPRTVDVTIYDAIGKYAGWALLTEQHDGVRLQLEVSGLTPGKHGFHIHAEAFDWLDFATAGGHFNPDSRQHGHDNPLGSHLGDMPNLVADREGHAAVDLVIRGATLAHDDSHSLIGRSIIIHGAEDDLVSDPAGNAGPRVAGGRIID